MKQKDLANYIVLIGLIIFFILLIGMHYSHTSLKEGASSLTNNTFSNPANKDTPRSQFDDGYSAIKNKIDEDIAFCKNTSKPINDRMNKSNQLLLDLQELKPKMEAYLVGRQLCKKNLVSDISGIVQSSSSSDEIYRTTTSISLAKVKQIQNNINLSKKALNKQLYEYARRINNIIKKIPNSIDDIQVGTIASVPYEKDASIQIETVDSLPISNPSDEYRDLKAQFPKNEDFNEIDLKSGKWIINMLIPKNPKGDVGKPGQSGQSGKPGQSGEPGQSGGRGAWGTKPPM